MIKRRVFCLVLVISVVLGFIPNIVAIAATENYEAAWFPAPVMQINQIAYESYSHDNQNAIDISPWGDVFAPFTGKIVLVDSRWGYVVLQSLNKVYYADGTLDYMTVSFMHDEDVSNLKKGDIINQGEEFYQAGGMGKGNPNAYADHVHISVYKGLDSGVSSTGGYGAGNVYAFDAFYLNTEQTTQIKNQGKMESGNNMTNGAPPDWNGRWNTELPGYLAKCTSYPSYGTIRVTASTTYVKSLPCSAATDSNSETIEKASRNDTYTAIGLYRNTAGNLWYKLQTKSGNTGYIYAGDTTFVEQLTDDVKLSGTVAPTELKQGSRFSIKGTITAQYQTIIKVGAWVDDSNGDFKTGETEDVDTQSYTLGSSKVDKGVIFNELAAGDFSYFVGATIKTYYAKDATSVSSKSQTIDLYESTFRVVADVVCSHSYNSTVTIEPTCGTEGVQTYTCSKCGESYTEVIAATGVHSYGAWVPATLPTCTAAGEEKATCASCGATKTRSVSATGHMYEETLIPASCLDYEKIRYTCLDCNDAYEEYTGTGYSEWSETKPVGVDDSLIESKTQYRYSDYETITADSASVDGYSLSGSDWKKTGNGFFQYVNGWPSGFDTSHTYYSTYASAPLTASETATSKRVINSDKLDGYIYYHWCRDSYTDGPINRRVEASKTGEFVAFHSFYSTTDPSTLTADTDKSYVYANADCCKDSHWYFAIPVYSQTYTNYRMRYTHVRWTDWSAWGDTAYTASSTRKVETRTMYRYQNKQLGDHSYVNDYCVHCGAKDPDAVTAVIRMEMTDATASAGDTVTVAVKAVDNPGFAGFSVVFVYNTDALTLTNISKGELLAGSESGMFTKNVAGAALNWTDSTNTHGTGTMFYLTFRVNDAAAAGQYEIAMYLKDHEPTNFVDENGKPVLTLNRFSAITVEEKSYTAGDINGDEQVSREDVVKLLLHVSAPTIFTIDAPADFNGDSLVTREDVVKLLLYVSAPNVFPLA